MVEREEVLKRHISPDLTEANLPQKLLRKRVSKRDVLDSEIGHIQQILALHLHREAGVGSAEVPGARIEGVGAVLSPVIGGEGLRESAFLCAVARNGKLSASPDLALADTLEEDGEVESLPICAESETILVARGCVADHHAVSRISVRAGSGRDVAISVNVHELHVARAAHKLVTVLELNLIDRVFRGLLVGGVDRAPIDHVDPFDPAVSTIDEIVLLEETIRDITVDVTIAAAGRVGVAEQTILPRSLPVRAFCDLGRGVGEGSGEVDSKAIGEPVAEIERDFPTVGAEVAVVALRRGVSECRRKGLARDYHILGVPAVPVERETDAVVPESEVRSEVKGLDHLPGYVAVHKRRRVIFGDFLSVAADPRGLSARKD